MLKAGGDIKRKELVSMFGDLSIDERGKMTDTDMKIAQEGDDKQSKYLTDQKN